jgi:hypothetical protein
MNPRVGEMRNGKTRSAGGINREINASTISPVAKNTYVVNSHTPNMASTPAHMITAPMITPVVSRELFHDTTVA